MELKSMKYEEKEPGPSEVMYGSPDRPKYSCGLCLSLDEEAIAKLGLKELPAVGDTMMIQARVQVVSTSLNENESGEQRYMSLQITDMAIGGDGK